MADKKVDALLSATLPLAGTEELHVVQGGNSRKTTTGSFYLPGGTDVAVTDGGTGASSVPDAQANLQLVPGTHVQAYNAGLADIAGLAKTDGNIIVGNGTNWVAESGATARASLGLTIGTDVQAYSAILAATTASFTTALETKLNGIAAGAEVNVNADWNAVSGDAQILNKPVLATVATTGAYSDLTGLPTLGALAAKDAVAISDISATGTPGATNYLRGDGTWGTPAGGGDMVEAVYDPQAIAGDAFARSNHTGTQSADTITDGTTNKVYTATEQDKLAGIETGAQANTVDSVAGETGAISAADLRTALNVENGADVTDADNVAAAGAGMLGSANTWTGVQTWAGNRVEVQGVAPAFDMKQTDGPSYRHSVNGNSWALQADADNNGSYETQALLINGVSQFGQLFGSNILTAANGISELNVKALNADGGFSFSTTATTTDIAGVFGGAWKTAHRLYSYTADAFAGSRATAAIMRETAGSGENGPSRTDYALHVETEKENYLTNTTLGEIDGLYINVNQGINGDSGGILVNHRKVASPSYGSVGIEMTMDWVAPTTGASQRTIRTMMGGHIPSTDVRQGGLGFQTQCTLGSAYTGYLVYDNGGTWRYPFIASSSLSQSDVYFGIMGTGSGGNPGTTWGGTPAAFINSAGTEEGWTLEATGMLIASRSAGQALDLRRLTSDGALGIFRRGTTQVGSISVTGAATAYNTSSDERLKENFVPLDAGELIDQIKTYRFDWKSGGSACGVKAQEVYDVFPDAVTVGEGEPEDEDFQPWVVDYSKFVPLLLAEVKALRAEIAALKGVLDN